MKNIIRRASSADAPALSDLFIATRAAMTYLPALHSDDETRRFIAHVVATQEVWISVTQTATKEDRVTAFAAIHDGPNKITLDHLYVAPFAQGKGHGAALLDHVKTQRPQGFSLWTFEKNTGAQRFYARHGLTLAKTTDGRDNEENLPDMLYVWAPDK
ncbi:MAG: GNAT family N-acetyltransferase [Parvibaculaceae bacterium]